jgi:ABC-type multidrug transport system ATPase subunit
MDNIIEVKELAKSYDSVKAVKSISFEVEEGELFGLIGPDGAGKTTVFRILATLIKPDSGEASVLGSDVVTNYKRIRRKVGYMPGRFSLYQDLSVRENLEFFASVFGTTIEENYELIRPIYHQLEPFGDRMTGDLSGGMKQKLALSCALIHKPKLLFLDEPTTGVDAVSRKEFWEMLHHLEKEGITILVSTPYMDEAGQCDRIALMQEGEILSIDTPDNIVHQFDNILWAVNADDKYKLIQILRTYDYAESVQPFGNDVHYTDVRSEPNVEELGSYLEANGIKNPEIKEIQPGIEDTFMRLMQRGVTYE